MRIVFDPELMAEAFRPEGAVAAAWLLAAGQGLVRLLGGRALLAMTPDLPVDQAPALKALADLMEPVSSHRLWRPRLKDFSADLMLMTAVAGRADALVTRRTGPITLAARRAGVAILAPESLAAAP